MAKRILTLCLALVIGIAFAMPAGAAVKSIKVGGDLTIRGIYRDNLDFLSTDIVPTSAWMNSITRLTVGAELTDNVSVVVRLLNERDWDTETAASTDIDLDLSYIKMKDLFVPGFSATLGRQEILLGKGFVVGNRYGTTGCGIGAINAIDLTSRKSFDAWRLDYEVGTAPVTITLLNAKIQEDAPVNCDLDLWGVNVGYKTDNLNVEGYVLQLADITPVSPTANTDLTTFGARVDHNVMAVSGLNYNLEAAFQTGDASSIGFAEDMEGWAGNGDISYTFQNPMQAKIGASWYYASCDKALVNGEGAFVPLYPDNLSDRMGRIAYAYSVNSGLVDWTGSGISVPKIYGSYKPSEKHMLSLAWFPSTTLTEEFLGEDEAMSELNLGYAYQYTEDVSFGLCVDYAAGGKVVTTPLCDDNALQLMGTVAVSF